MKEIQIREISFNNLFENILSVNYTENWGMYETNDKSKNPLVVFKTKKWDKLLDLIQTWLDKNQTKEFNANPTKKDLVIGSLIEINYLIESEIKLRQGIIK